MAGNVGLKVIEAKFYKDTKCKTTAACSSKFLYLHFNKKCSHSYTLTHAAGFWTRWFSYPLSLLSSILTHLPTLTLCLWPYLTVVLAFLAFVVKNGSIVVNDKSHHQASFHMPQLFYFVVFACAMAAPHFIFNLRLVVGFLKVLLTKRRWMAAFVCLFGLVMMAVHHYT